MCKFGCSTTNMTFKCKYCGAPFCSSCGNGAGGKMRAGNVCSSCNKSNHRGDKV
ncbi:Conserved_hypothetical protein [Hexamita inflata]|uniref:Uncharacterized protein n=1 Tax=Hexamita inflata TaxID=28002 RepID=A0AA86TD90_9EUKA|nr:Conserved hypothetical protein [Hexamita inflata]CAI9915373.1 Conserved hypothetical protein [Hexamita inflata]